MAGKDLFAFEVLNEKQFQASTSEEMKNLRMTLTQAVTDSENKLHTVLELAHRGIR